MEFDDELLNGEQLVRQNYLRLDKVWEPTMDRVIYFLVNFNFGEVK